MPQIGLSKDSLVLSLSRLPPAIPTFWELFGAKDGLDVLMPGLHDEAVRPRAGSQPGSPAKLIRSAYGIGSASIPSATGRTAPCLPWHLGLKEALPLLPPRSTRYTPLLPSGPGASGVLSTCTVELQQPRRDANPTPSPLNG